MELLNYIVEGNGPPVIMLHGWASSLREWEEIVPEFVTAGFRVYAPDLFGHGDSPRPADPRLYYCQMAYTSLRNWIDSLQLKEAPILIGHSLGGWMSLRYAIGHPYKVRRLILLNPFYTPEQLPFFVRLLSGNAWLNSLGLRYMPEQLIRYVTGLTPTARAHLSKEQMRRISLDYKRASPHIMHLPLTAADLTGELMDIPTRTLVMWGEKDQTLDTSFFPAMVEILPDAVSQSIPEGGHEIHQEHPRIVIKAIFDFLMGLEA
jgi:pimeloyl-ACP methyl ester carboxylesterase